MYDPMTDFSAMTFYKSQTMAKYLQDHATSNPDKTAVYFYGSTFSYRWLDEKSDALALTLAEQGIRKGDVVAAYMQNCPQFVVSYFAAQKLGAVFSPCNPMLKEKELTYQLNDLGAVALIASAELVQEFERVEDCAVHTLIVTGFQDVLDLDKHRQEFSFTPPNDYVPSCDFVSWEDALEITPDKALHSSMLNPEIDLEQDVSLIIYTSGTSGLPKGAMLSYTNCVFKANCVASTYGYGPDDRVSATMPIFHVAGMLVGMTSVFVAGASMILQARFDGEDFVTMASKYKMTISYTTPPINSAILATGRASEMSALRLCIGTSFGSQITESLSNKWKAETGNDFFEFAYGMSETHTADTMTPPGGIVWGSTGKPTFGTSIKITDPEDRSRELPPGELGEISVKSPAVFLGYKGKPEATKSALQNGRYFSGDMGRLDENGYLFFDGRFKEMIKCNGYSVFPEEVEKYLQDHPAVKQAVAVGVPDDERGESVRAFIVLKDDLDAPVTEEDIIQWAKKNMAAYKYPRSVRFIDKVPETATGKMLRAKLRNS
ncbi:acyl--CoA ligase [Corynebacterium sp. 153RC1]|uniref:class I adenylate-forming enzyme family protein n=1 Tax=unclassified Corynebacterium TaxID=2624378 RepID=UPI00211B9429|nr:MULTISPECIES: class I adenylate-forming enzyme family protein [unclassified Corynebacterium]MCQ9353431.1 acyl--CoA ligase [Corynebacterium sp. 209RC1]MCQ9355653.1 acyl--CoA ligase [Corynebacterium sp. 1222RC1]MCQ9357846.1 acyl--CoA ligase [Corynebacterium sp. 122RC1]MCQ9362174.1 acyl--CoA ligase [Corynebacterium sp. 153RC1]MCQ9364314.1 acyl--CoA ligase [Corynebacterium sp. 732RC1]